MPSESGYLPPSLTLEPDYFTSKIFSSRRGEGGGEEQNKAQIPDYQNTKNTTAREYKRYSTSAEGVNGQMLAGENCFYSCFATECQKKKLN